jgi:hypothetical protein
MTKLNIAKYQPGAALLGQTMDGVTLRANCERRASALAVVRSLTHPHVKQLMEHTQMDSLNNIHQFQFTA